MKLTVVMQHKSFGKISVHVLYTNEEVLQFFRWPNLTQESPELFILYCFSNKVFPLAKSYRWVSLFYCFGRVQINGRSLKLLMQIKSRKNLKKIAAEVVVAVSIY